MDLTVKLDDVEKALDEAAMQIAVATGATPEAARAALIAVSVGDQLLEPEPLPMSTAGTFAAAYEAVTGEPYRGGMNRAERRRWMKRHLNRRGRQLVKRAREGG